MTVCSQLTGELSSFQRDVNPQLLTSRARTVSAMLVSLSSTLDGLHDDTTAAAPRQAVAVQGMHSSVRSGIRLYFLRGMMLEFVGVPE